MDNNYMLGLLGAMDRLWFHQIILFSQPTNSLISNQNHESTLPPHQHQHVSDSFTSPSSSLFLSPLDDDDDQDQENSSESLLNTALQDDSNYEEEEEDEDEDEHEDEDEENSNKKQQKTRRNILGTQLMNRSNSSSPSSSSAEKLNIGKESRRRRSLVLQKSMSCRSFGELELEEVKGFMDLGFIFKKENMSPRMMSLLPGLQRLGGVVNHKNKVDKAAAHEVEEDEENKSRPYLSEAWLIKKPNSPLLNLKISKLSAPSQMKKHLIFWARSVASEIQ